MAETKGRIVPGTHVENHQPLCARYLHRGQYSGQVPRQSTAYCPCGLGADTETSAPTTFSIHPSHAQSSAKQPSLHTLREASRIMNGHPRLGANASLFLRMTGWEQETRSIRRLSADFRQPKG